MIVVEPSEQFRGFTHWKRCKRYSTARKPNSHCARLFIEDKGMLFSNKRICRLRHRKTFLDVGTHAILRWTPKQTMNKRNKRAWRVCCTPSLLFSTTRTSTNAIQ